MFLKTELKITDTDREWVDENMKYLIDVLGYPASNFDQFLLNSEYFPLFFSTKEIIVTNLIEDLKVLLDLIDVPIDVDIIHDIKTGT